MSKKNNSSFLEGYEDFKKRREEEKNTSFIEGYKQYKKRREEENARVIESWRGSPKTITQPNPTSDLRLENQIKRTNSQTLPRIAQQVADDYLQNRRYSDVSSDIEHLKQLKGGAARRDRDTGVYDRALEMLKGYSQRYRLDDTDTSPEAVKDRENLYNDNKREISRLNSQLEAEKGGSLNQALRQWLDSYDDNGIITDEDNQYYIDEIKNNTGYDISQYVGGLDSQKRSEKAEQLRATLGEDTSVNDRKRIEAQLDSLNTQNRKYERYQKPIDDYQDVRNDPNFSETSFADVANSDRRDKLSLYSNSHNEEFNNSYDDPVTLSNIVAEGDVNGWGTLTNSEKDIYYHLLDTQGEEAAYKYLDDMKLVLQKRETGYAEEQAKDVASARPLGIPIGGLASVPGKMLGGAVAFVDDTLHTVTGQEINPYDPAHRLANETAAVMESDVDYINDKTNNWNVGGFSLGDAYQALASVEEMGLGVGMGTAAYSALMSMDAAQSKAKELYDSGASNEVIATESLASGAFEYVFEKVSLDMIVNKIISGMLTKESAARYITAALMSAGVEGSEEVATEAANYVADIIIRKEQSERQTLIKDYLAQGYSQEEAEKRATDAFIEDLYKSFMGGALAGALGGGYFGGAYNSVKSNIQERSERNQYIRNVGEDVTGAGNAQALLDRAAQIDDPAVKAQAQRTQQALDKANQNSTKSTNNRLSRETGKLYAAMQDSTAQGIQNAEANEIKAAIKSAYAAETGETDSSVISKAADAIYKSEYTDERLTRSERNLAETAAAQSALESVKNNPDLIESATQKAQERGFRDYVETAKLTQKQETKTDDDVDIAEFNYHEDDGKVYTSDGKKQVDIASVASIGDNDITFNLNDGQTESAKALDMPTNQAVLAQSILDVQKKIGVPLTADIANTLYQGYEQSDSPSVSAYMQDAQTVLFNGYANNTAPDSSIKLPQGLRNQLYRMGRQLAASHTQAQQQSVNARVKGNKSRKGTVTFQDGINRNKLDPRRRAGVDAVEHLAQSLGFDVVFYRSTKDGKGRFSSEYVRKNKFVADGQQAPSGFWRGGKMYLDINAGMNGEGLILFTASHELVHMIREGSPEDFKALSDFLVKNYAEQGVDINDLVRKEMARSTNLTRDQALEEVIAESCETFLRDTTLNDKAQELYKQNPTLWSRIREALKRIVDAVKQWYSVARPQSEEARITMRAGVETLENAYDLWTKGIIKSAENLRNMERESTDAKYQGRAEAQDTEYLDAVERGDMETAQKMVDEAAKAAGYDRHLYHGAKAGGGFTVFKGWQYFTASKAYAERYIQRDTGKGLYDVYVKSDRLFDTRKADDRAIFGEYKNEYGMGELQENGLPDWTDGYDLSEIIEENELDYDGIVLDEGGDLVDGKPVSRGLSYVIRDSSQVKSADPVTYDDNGDVIPLSERFNESNPDIRYQSRVDSDYLSAVERGDMETAQRMVEKAAERAFAKSKIRDEDGKLMKVYHGTDADFTVFDRAMGRANMDIQGMFFSPWDIDAGGYGPNVRAFYLNITNPANESTGYKALNSHKGENYAGIKAREELERMGYDGVNNSDEEYIAFNSEQIKLADPVTYDDNGDVIPLSERFNESNKDIRYQSRSSADNVAYKYAVKNKDTEKAQRLVDRTANRVFADSKVRGKDGKLRKVYHYTNTDFYSFDTGRSGRNQGQTHGDGIYISTSPDEFSYAGKKRMTLYADITNPFEMQLTEDQARNVLEKYAVTKHNLDQYDGLYRNHAMNALQSPIKVFDYLKEYADDNGIKVSEILQDLGFDGVHDGSEWVAFSSKQLKSADPVTYDNDGNVIPLSERFNESNNDIRYQSRDDDLFSVDDIFDDDSISSTVAREYITHHEDIGEVLRNIADIELPSSKVQSIVNRVIRNELGYLDEEARRTLSIELQLALERVSKTDAQDVSNEMINAVRKAVEGARITDERTQASYQELRNVFKGKKFYLTDEQINQLKEHDMTFDDFRKAMFGKVTIVKRENAKRSINGGYADAQQLSLEGLHDVLDNPEEVLGIRRDEWDNKNYDAPYIIKKAFDTLQEQRSQLVTDMYSDETIDDMAIAIAAKITGDIVEEKYKSKYKGKNSQQIRQALASQQKQTNDYIDSLVEKLMEKHEAELAEQEERNSQKLAELKAKERERAEKREQDLKKEYQEQRDRNRESRKRTEFRDKIRRIADSFNKRLTAPKNKQYIPQEFIEQTLDVLNSVAFRGKRGVAISSTIADLRQQYNELQDSEYQSAYTLVVEKMLSSIGSQAKQEAKEWVPKRNKAIAQENKRLKKQGKPLKPFVTEADFNVNNMSLELLDLVYKCFKSMDYVIRESVKMTDTNFKKETHQIGRDWIAEIKAVQKEHVGILSGYVQTMLSAERFFNRIAGFKKNSTSSQLFDMLNKGQLAQTQYEMEFTQIFADLIQDKQLKSLYDTKNLVDIGLEDEDGNKVPITRGMMLSLYMHLLNEDNTRHVMGGGLTVPDMKDYYKGDVKKAFGSGMKSVRVGALDYSQYAEGIKSVIERQLTEYEIKWIEAAQEFFDVASRKALNETTMKLYGFRRANVNNYFPIHTDSNYRAPSFENIAKDMSLENSGFMKERVKASNPIYLEDIVDVVNDQISKVSKYCGMTLPIRNFQKVYGTTAFDFESSVQRELNRKFSASKKNAGATKYIDNLMTDLTSGRSTDDGFIARMLGRARGNLAQATLTLNPRVAIAQAASYPTAAAVIGWEPLFKALRKGGKNNTVFSRADREAIAEISPLLWKRTQGYSNVEIGDIKELRKQRHQVEGKLKKAMGWIEFFDGMTVGRLFYACQYYVDEQNPELKRGTAEYNAKVADVYNKVIERTQPNYTTLQRPDILRNPNALIKSLSMFMTQRLQNFNIVYDAVGTYNRYLKDYKKGLNGVTAEDVKGARTTLVRSVTSQLVAAGTIVGMKLLADVLLHSVNAYRDDDDELTAESVGLKLLDNFADTLFGSVLFGSDLYSLVKSAISGSRYYGISLSGVDSLVDAVTSIVNLRKGITLDSANKAATSICQLFGIPLNNAEKIGKAVYYWASDISGGEAFESGVNRTIKQNLHRYETRLNSGEADKANELLTAMLDDKMSQGKTEKEAKSWLRGRFTATYKQRYIDAMNSKDTEEVKNIREILLSTGLYGSLSDLDKTLKNWLK